MHVTLIKHGVVITCHMLFVWKIEKVQCVIEYGVERILPYVVCVENGGCGA